MYNYIAGFIIDLLVEAEVPLKIFKIKLSDCFSNIYSIRSSESISVSSKSLNFIFSSPTSAINLLRTSKKKNNLF